MVGQTVGLRVIEVDRQRRRLIFSQRQAYRAWQRRRKRQLLEELKVGQVRHGVVSSITDFGAFVDIGGVDGLVHVSELSWHHVDNPREVVQIGDEVDVQVLEVDRGKERIGLSIKKTIQDPWEQVETKYHPNQLIEGKVTRVTDIGAFIELEPGVEGLLHVSELVGAPNVTPQEVLHPGQVELFKILRIEGSRRRIGLSAKRVRRDEWERWAAEKAAQEAAEMEAANAAEEAVAEAEAAVTPAEATVEAETAAPEEGEAEATAEVKAEAVVPEEGEAEAAPETSTVEEPAE